MIPTTTDSSRRRRRVDACINCGEPRAMAALGLCFRFYRRQERASQPPDEPEVDRHNPGIRPEQKRLIRAYDRVIEGLADLGVSRKHVLKIRAILMPYLQPIAYLLYVNKEESEEQ